MGVKFKSSKNEFPKMNKNINTIKGKKVIAGAMEGEHAWLAGIHEYGCRITVSPKMRAYLHHKGLHLKKGTTTITIPERSFLRSSWDEHIDEVKSSASRALPDVIAGTMSSDQYCKMVGLQLASMIKDYARDLSSPPNHPFTVSNKNSSNPLVDTGDMIESITYKVE